MGNLLKLGLFLLLCMKIALALKCRECRSYTHKKCNYIMRTCIAEAGEYCMTTRFWTPPYTVNEPKDALSMCMKNCIEDDYQYGIDIALITCCDSHDFCNDVNIPIDLH
uniref:Prostate and testis expressed 7 n=1 Tax=Nannospalax galili TaxID=1026970 RepID=A0A8C6W5N2_NANGA